MRPPRQCSQLSKGTRQKLLHEYERITSLLNWIDGKYEGENDTEQRMNDPATVAVTSSGGAEMNDLQSQFHFTKQDAKRNNINK